MRLHLQERGFMAKTMLICFALIFVHASAFADDPETGYNIHVAIEYVKNNKSFKPPIIGSFEYTGTSIDIVRIFEGPLTGGIYTQAQVYILSGKTVEEEGLHHVIGKNQYGTLASGTIDFRDKSNTQINLKMEEGYAITNITEYGKQWRIKHIPNITIGE